MTHRNASTEERGQQSQLRGQLRFDFTIGPDMLKALQKLVPDGLDSHNATVLGNTLYEHLLPQVELLIEALLRDDDGQQTVVIFGARDESGRFHTASLAGGQA